ncbi:MAG TPA: pilus assembly protein PilM, partial [Vicinamibacterales bacterium]
MILTSLVTTPAPSVAMQIAQGFVSAIALGRHGGAPVIVAHAAEALPAGAVTPALNDQNIADRRAVGQAVSRVLGQLGGRQRRLALVLPDSVAKVSLVRLQSVPARTQDLAELIRWHVRKSAPFPLEEAQVTYSPGAATLEGGREFVVALARRAVVREFEGVCEEAGAHAGIVDLATFSLVNAVLAAEGPMTGDWLLVHITPDYGSIVILRGQDLIFFRSRAEGSDESLPDLVHQTAMYYEDRLGGHGFARVMVTGSGGEGWTPAAAPTTFDDIRRQIDARLGVRTETVDPQ